LSYRASAWLWVGIISAIDRLASPSRSPNRPNRDPISPDSVRLYRSLGSLPLPGLAAPAAETFTACYAAVDELGFSNESPFDRFSFRFSSDSFSGHDSFQLFRFLDSRLVLGCLG